MANINIQTVECGMIRENAYVVCREGATGCVVIDPGDDFMRVKAAVGDNKLAAVLLTHGHFDHTMAAGPIAGAFGVKTYAHADEMEMLCDVRLNGMFDLMGMDEMPEPAIRAEAYEETIDVADMRFRVLHTPGHSKGSVCLYLEDEGILFSGDTLFLAGFGRMDLHGGSPEAMRGSLKRLFALPEDVRVYPGHGPVTTIGAEKRRYRL